MPDGNPAHRRLAHDAIISLDKGMLHQPARAGAVAFLIDDSGVYDGAVDALRIFDDALDRVGQAASGPFASVEPRP